MRILYLGPPCIRLERHLQLAGHTILQQEDPIHVPFLEENNFQFGVSYRYTHILRQPEIDWFRGKLVNLHISYLPWNRGADPNLWSFLEDSPKGVTIHQMDTGVDTGPVLLQEHAVIDTERESLYSSWNKLAEQIELLFMKYSEDIVNGRIPASPQSGIGSVHKRADKEKFMHLLAEKGWHTPVKQLLRKALCNAVEEQHAEHQI